LIAFLVGAFLAIASINSWFIVPTGLVKGCFIFAAVLVIFCD
jgi:hypothetical protein